MAWLYGSAEREQNIDAIDKAIEALSTPSGDLISRQWLLDVYGDYIGDNGEPKYYVPLEVVRQNIKDAPSVDVVRCKDCKHRDLFSCPLTDNDFQKDDDYCAWGERND